MRQRYKLYGLLLAAPLLLTGCSDDEGSAGSSSNKEAINICTGISTSAAGVGTRALELASSGYHAFKKGTQISLRTEGVWTGKDPSNIIKLSTATTSEEKTTDSGDAVKKYNELSIADTATPLYWDDFGTADPANTTSRADGLTMYAAAVDGLTTGGPVISTTGDNISWDVTTTQNGTDGWSKKDLLISNNIKNGTPDNRYKFANKATAANLIFNHAMSKITVNLYRGDGFTETEVTSGLTADVKVLQMSTAGKVDVTTGAVSDLSTKADVTPHLDEHKTSCANNGDLYSTYSALVYPGNTFGSTTDVLKITVNGNTLYAKGAKIIEAAESGTATSHTLKAGTNYIFNIIVSKTGLHITAQIAPWTEYTAEKETPLLNITADRTDGTTNNNLATGFKLYYSNNAATKYTTSTMFGLETGTASPVTVAWNATDSKYTYPSLYWPNHTTGYFFRGVVALNDANNAIAKDGADEFHPTVTADTDGDYINLESGNAEKCNVLVGSHANTVTGNNTTGALATEGNVQLTFKHKMAQVIVKLETTTGDDKVNLGTKADDMAKVEVLSYKKDGKVLIGSGTVTATGTEANYVMPAVSTTYSATTTDGYYSRASYMVPQTLTDNMMFRITITNADGTTDTYTSAAIKTIKVQTGSETATAPTAWNEGCKYVYTLTIKKTGINVTAVLKPWTEYTGSTVVPFM